MNSSMFISIRGHLLFNEVSVSSLTVGNVKAISSGSPGVLVDISDDVLLPSVILSSVLFHGDWV